MTATDRFLHELRHAVRAARWVLLLHGSLVVSGLAGIWFTLHSPAASRWQQAWIDEHGQRPQALAMLLGGLGLALMVLADPPSSATAFAVTRPVRSWERLGSRLVLYAGAMVLPLLLGQALICWWGVGLVPWGDVALGILTQCVVPGLCLAAVASAASGRRQAGLMMVILVMLWEVLTLQPAGEGMFQRAIQHLNGVSGVSKALLESTPLRWRSVWQVHLSQPSRWLGNQGLIAALSCLSLALTHRGWRKTALIVVLAGVPAASLTMRWWMLDHPAASLTPPGLETLRLANPRIACMQRLGALFADAQAEALPPRCVAQVGLLSATVETPQGGSSKMQPDFRYLALPTRPSVEGLSPDDRLVSKLLLDQAFPNLCREPGAQSWSVGMPPQMALFDARSLLRLPVLRDGIFVAGSQSLPVRVHSPVKVRGTEAIELLATHLAGRLQLKPGASWQGPRGLSIAVSRLVHQYESRTTAAGLQQQWRGVEIYVDVRRLKFAHDAAGRQPLTAVLWNPARNECFTPAPPSMLWDETSGGGRFHDFNRYNPISGTPVINDSDIVSLRLDRSRIGKVDQHWLDQAELLLVSVESAGLYTRPLSLDGIEPQEMIQPH